MYIHELTGAFHCFRCGGKGSWFDFKKVFTGEEVDVGQKAQGQGGFSISLNSMIENETIDLGIPFQAFKNLEFIVGFEEAFAYLT